MDASLTSGSCFLDKTHFVFENDYRRREGPSIERTNRRTDELSHSYRVVALTQLKRCEIH